MRWMLMVVLTLAACTKDDPRSKPAPVVCAGGGKPIGTPPPKGKGVWCEQQLEGGKFIASRTDGTKWVEGAMSGRDRHGTWTWYAPDGSVAAVRVYNRGEMLSEKVTDPAIKTPGE